MNIEKMTIEGAKQAVEFKTRENYAMLKGLTMEQLCKQYAANVEGLKKMRERALSHKSGMNRGYTVAELDEKIEIYTILSTMPNQ
jgi:hypothetical protein